MLGTNNLDMRKEMHILNKGHEIVIICGQWPRQPLMT